MKKLLAILLLFPAMLFGQAGAEGPRGFTQPNDASTATVINELAIIQTNQLATLALTTSTTVQTFIVIGGAGVSGSVPNASLAKPGSLAKCVMDATIASGAAGAYVISSTTTGGYCHPQLATPPVGVYVVGTVATNSTASASASNVLVGYFPPWPTQTIAYGTWAAATSQINSAACSTTGSLTTTGGTIANVATTDTIIANFNANPVSTVGYQPLATGMLTIVSWPTAGGVSFDVCNNTSGAITPGAITLNWRVVR